MPHFWNFEFEDCGTVSNLFLVKLFRFHIRSLKYKKAPCGWIHACVCSQDFILKMHETTECAENFCISCASCTILRQFGVIEKCSPVFGRYVIYLLCSNTVSKWNIMSEVIYRICLFTFKCTCHSISESEENL